MLYNPDYYYHWCVFDDEKIVILGKNEKDISKMLSSIQNINYRKTYKVIGTIEPLEDMMRYYNEKSTSDGIFAGIFEEEDAFVLTDSIFVDCTEAVRKAIDKNTDK